MPGNIPAAILAGYLVAACVVGATYAPGRGVPAALAARVVLVAALVGLAWRRWKDEGPASGETSPVRPTGSRCAPAYEAGCNLGAPAIPPTSAGFWQAFPFARLAATLPAIGCAGGTVAGVWPLIQAGGGAVVAGWGLARWETAATMTATAACVVAAWWRVRRSARS